MSSARITDQPHPTTHTPRGLVGENLSITLLTALDTAPITPPAPVQPACTTVGYVRNVSEQIHGREWHKKLTACTNLEMLSRLLGIHLVCLDQGKKEMALAVNVPPTGCHFPSFQIFPIWHLANKRAWGWGPGWVNLILGGFFLLFLSGAEYIGGIDFIRLV